MNQISALNLEIGIVKSSLIGIKANDGLVDYSSALWPYEKSVAAVNADCIRSQYSKYAGRIFDVASKLKVENIISVGMESPFNDIMMNVNKDFNIVIIPNSPDVDTERIQKNYTSRTIVEHPYNGYNYLGNSIVVVPTYRLGDNTVYMYSYSKHFINENVKNYSYCTIAVEMLPSIKDLDYRTPPSSCELVVLSSINESFFTETLSFKN